MEQSHVDSQQNLKKFIHSENTNLYLRIKASQADLLIKFSAIVAGFISAALAIAKLLWWTTTPTKDSPKNQAYEQFTVGIFTEYNDSLKKIEYKYPETIPDDFLHSLTYALAHEISTKFAVGRYGA